MLIIDRAVMDFGRFIIADLQENGKSHLIGAVPIQAKAVLQNSACIDDQTAPTKWLFCVHSAVSDTIERTPIWASCTEYIGRRLPLDARLANLVKVSRNLSRLSGIMSKLWIELTRHAHLVLTFI